MNYVNILHKSNANMRVHRIREQIPIDAMHGWTHTML